MRKLLVLAAVAVAAVTAGSAFGADTAQQSVMKSCSAKWTAMSAADKAKTKHNDYMSSCMKAPAPTAAAAAPAMAMKPAATGSMAMSAKPAAGSMAMKPAAAAGGSAKCKDGTVVTYKVRSGTCSGHKGVATWM